MRLSPTVCACTVAAASALYGCGAQVFICEDPSDCPNGTCEPSGFCSFPDDACTSGQRYGAHAPASVANECVDPIAGTSGSGDADATSSPSTTVTTTLDASSAEVGSVDEASTTPLTDTGDDTSTTTTSASSSDSGMAPDVPVELPPCTVETFDDEMLDEFGWWGGLMPVIADGTLSVTLATMPTTGGLDFPSGGFVEREAKVVVVGVPNQAEATQVALAVGDGTTTMLILHEQDGLIVRHDDGVTLDNRVTVMPVVPATWRIRSHDDTLYFERDIGNGDWEMLWSEAPDFDLAQAGAFFYVNTWLDAMMPGTAQIDEISDCPYGGG